MIKKLTFILFLTITVSCSKRRTNTYINEKKLDSLFKYYERQPLDIQKHFFDSIINTNFEKLSTKSKGNIYFELGNIYLSKKNYSQSIDNFNKAKNEYKKNNNSKMLAKIFLNIGIAYTYIHNDKKSIANIYKALNISISNNYNKIKHKAYAGLAQIYFRKKNYYKSLEILNKIVEGQKKEKDSIGLSATYQNMGLLYKNIGKFKKAYEYIKKGLDLKLKTGDITYLEYNYGNYANIIYLYKNDTNEALKYYNKAIEVIKKYNFAENSEIYYQIGKIYLDNKKNNLAKKFFYKSLKFELEPEKRKKIIEKLANIAIDLKQYDLMKSLWKKHDSILLEIEKQKNEEQIKLIEDNYSLNNKKITLETEKKLLKKNIFNFWLLLIFITFLVTIIGLLFVNRDLKSQKEKLSLERKVLQAQLNPHFIFNSLAALQNSMVFESPIRSITYLSRFAKMMRKIFQYLNKGEINLKDEIDLLEEYVEMQNIRKEHKIELKINIDKNIDQFDTQIPPLLLQPLIENSIEHGFNNFDKLGIINLNIKKENNKVCFEVIDNGNGLYLSEKPKKREHALDILKKRIDLFNKKTKNNFTIEKIENGTRAYFCIDYKAKF